jgi:hypothetical protein
MTSIHPGSAEAEKSVFSGRVAVGLKRGLGCVEAAEAPDCLTLPCVDIIDRSCGWFALATSFVVDWTVTQSSFDLQPTFHRSRIGRTPSATACLPFRRVIHIICFDRFRS